MKKLLMFLFFANGLIQAQQNSINFQELNKGSASNMEINYRIEKVKFNSKGITVVGNLFIPENANRRLPAVVIIGPVAYVKEQSPLQYATRLAKAGFVALIFDPRYHGESGGEPRRFESGKAKVEDISSAIEFLSKHDMVEANHIYALGVCQGSNWMIEETTKNSKIKALAVVAAHYLTKETVDMYNGGSDKTQDRINRANHSLQKFKESGEVVYIPIVSESDPTSLLLPKPIYQWYIRWADRGLFWNFHGLWENRITQMSEEELWSYRVDQTVKNLYTPTLVIHADNAATGKDIPRKIYDLIPAKDKKLIWLGDKVQFQFYEDPITIDTSISHIIQWFNQR